MFVPTESFLDVTDQNKQYNMLDFLKEARKLLILYC